MWTALVAKEHPGKQGVGLGLMHLVVLATSRLLTAGAVPVLLTGVWMHMVNVMGKSMGEVGD